MPKGAKASVPVIRRLPKYYRYLKGLKSSGVTSISSRELAAMLGTTASQVRQDFNCFGGVYGRQGIGYSVDTLVSMLEGILFGDGNKLPSILIGTGRLGTAVSRFIARDSNGYELLAAFDSDPAKVGQTLNGLPIQDVRQLRDFCAEHHPLVAVLCLPPEGARTVTDTLVEMGIIGFWNFSHYDMSVDYPGIVVENVHLGDSLMSLGYQLRSL